MTYIQIPSSDIAASATFYEKVFGWSTQDRGSEEHTSFEDGAKRMIGAFVKNRSIAREPGILPYVYVDGIDAAIERVLAAGERSTGGRTPRMRCGQPECVTWPET